jgi:hypothetical protein
MGLFDRPVELNSAEDSLESWLAENPDFWPLFVRFSREAKAAGLARFSADAVCHRIRWSKQIETKGDRFKVNDHWVPQLARRLMAELPEEFAGFFELRKCNNERDSDRAQ